MLKRFVKLTETLVVLIKTWIRYKIWGMNCVKVERLYLQASRLSEMFDISDSSPKSLKFSLRLHRDYINRKNCLQRYLHEFLDKNFRQSIHRSNYVLVWGASIFIFHSTTTLKNFTLPWFLRWYTVTSVFSNLTSITSSRNRSQR